MRVSDIVGGCLVDRVLVEVLGEARGEGLDTPFGRRDADIVGGCK